MKHTFLQDYLKCDKSAPVSYGLFLPENLNAISFMEQLTSERLKHTPGQWLFMFGHTPKSVEELEVLPQHSHDSTTWKFKEIKIGDSNNRIIATIGCRTTSDGVTSEEFEGNAKLIVAAPDLLYALIETQKHLLDKGYSNLDTVYSCISNAIDKATK